MHLLQCFYQLRALPSQQKDTKDLILGYKSTKTKTYVVEENYDYLIYSNLKHTLFSFSTAKMYIIYIRHTFH